MQTVGLSVILGADFSSAEEAMAKFRQSVNSLASETSKAFANMAGTASNIGNAFKPVSDGAKNATQIVINESKARVQADNEETSAALNASKLKIQALREQQAAQRAATQAKKAEKDEYGQLVAKNQALVREYYNASAALIRYGEASGFTAQKIEEMAVKAREGQEQLKQIEAGAGRFQRNVGNYSSATLYLNQTIAQLTGEIPNFFQSMKIGFMSISNNIQPIIFALEALKKENADLAAQGLATKSAFQTLTKALFGWQTVLFVGVGLISAYGGKLVDWATGADEAKAKAKELKDRQTELNNAFESGASSASKAIVEIQSLSAEMTNSNTPLDKKIDLYNQIIAQYPQLATGTGTWSDKISTLASTINTELIPALRKQAIMQGYAAEAAKLGQQLAAKSAESAGLLAKRESLRTVVSYSKNPSLSTLRDAAAAEKAYTDNQDAVKGLNRELDAMINNQVKVSQALDNTILSHRTYKEQLQNTVKAEQARLDSLKAGTPAFNKQYEVLQKAKNALKAYDPPLKDAKTHLDALAKSQNNLNAELKETEAKLKAGVIDAFQALKERVSAVSQHLDKLFKNGGTQAAIQADIDLLKIMNYQLSSMSKVDLTNLKKLGVTPEKSFSADFHEATKGAQDRAAGLYDQIGIAGDLNKSKDRRKDEAKDQVKYEQELNREFNKSYSIMNKLVGGPLDSFTNALFNGDNAMEALGNSIKDIVKNLAEAVIKAGIFSAIMSAINPTSFAAGGGFLGVLGKLLPFASGGIVTGPTPALVGEAGPEAIIPLNKLGSIMGNRDLNVRISGRLRGMDINVANEKAQAFKTR